MRDVLEWHVSDRSNQAQGSRKTGMSVKGLAASRRKDSPLTLLVKEHRRPRWVAMLVIVGLLSALTAMGVAVRAHSSVSAIPSNYFAVVDSDGANDVNSDQVDLTQMGRDDTDATKYSLFWSWDSINSWTGSGQTGDACALFDTGGDGKIDKAVCARVANFNANPNEVRIVPQDATHPVFIFNCSNAKNDRCAQPSGALPYTVGTQVTAGVLAGSTIAPNLQTDTDPFAAGQSFPHDTTIAITVLKSLVGNGNLVNVCSYPSAGNGGNNNPFDCIVNPGSGFLKIVKVAGTTTQVFSFAVVPTPSGSNPVQITGSGNSGNLALGFTTTGSVTETVPANWTLSSAACTKADNSSTGSKVGNAVTGITIQSGLLTTCTFTNSPANGSLTIIKVVDNTAGGTKAAGDFTYDGGGTSGIDDEVAAVSPGKSHSLATGTTFTVVENDHTGYTVDYSAGCSGTISSGVTSTCTITNTAIKNDPTGGTTMTWVVKDAASFAIRAGAGNASSATITFRLYNAAGCADVDQFGTSDQKAVTLTNAGATAGASATGYTVPVGTYYWRTFYGGDAFNNAASTSCTAEITTISTP